MAGTLASRTQETKIIQRLAELEQTIFEMRSNQVQKITYGNIVIDGTGTQGVITIGNGMTLTVDANGNGKLTLGTGSQILLQINNTTHNGQIIIGNITIDGQGTITVSDGTNNRVLMGYQAGGF